MKMFWSVLVEPRSKHVISRAGHPPIAAVSSFSTRVNERDD
jgi:hypothetical protein